MKPLLLTIVLVIAVACSKPTAPPVTNEQARVAIEKAVVNHVGYQVIASTYGRKPVKVEAVFIDGNKGRVDFTLETRPGISQATLEKATDGRWYITLVSINDTITTSAPANIPIE